MYETSKEYSPKSLEIFFSIKGSLIGTVENNWHSLVEGRVFFHLRVAVWLTDHLQLIDLGFEVSVGSIKHLLNLLGHNLKF